VSRKNLQSRLTWRASHKCLAHRIAGTYERSEFYVPRGSVQLHVRLIISQARRDSWPRNKVLTIYGIIFLIEYKCFDPDGWNRVVPVRSALQNFLRDKQHKNMWRRRNRKSQQRMSRRTRWIAKRSSSRMRFPYEWRASLIGSIFHKETEQGGTVIRLRTQNWELRNIY
jgi:hypothetical protein